MEKPEGTDSPAARPHMSSQKRRESRLTTADTVNERERRRKGEEKWRDRVTRDMRSNSNWVVAHAHESQNRTNMA